MKLEGVSSQRADTRARLEVSSYEMDHYDRHGDDNDNDGDRGRRNMDIESIRWSMMRLQRSFMQIIDQNSKPKSKYFGKIFT